ncbi:MAG: DUF502 domain-containing protein [Thermoanaerobaculum sp.]|nr:DUF502 domain-containing protein [Thermoanaerobaculum sp.]MDW7966801.1 DUF502 domain-containing protein [Thermoanaerobaculum sp.]
MEQKHERLHDSVEFPLVVPRTAGKTGFLAFLRSRLVTGALVAFPLVVTLFFGRFLFNLLDRWFYPWSVQLFGRPVPGLGAAIALILMLFLGMAAHNVLGRRLLRLGEAVLTRIPVLRPVYLGAREVSRALSRDRTQGFRRVVLIPFPSPGAWCVAFQTGEFEHVTPEGRVPMVAVFMPTTPNPTTGFFLAYPKDAVRPTNLSVEEAVKVVISGGLAAGDLARLFQGAGR